MGKEETVTHWQTNKISLPNQKTRRNVAPPANSK